MFQYVRQDILLHTICCHKMAHGPWIVTLPKVEGGHLCEIPNCLVNMCDISPDMRVGHYATVGHFEAEYNNIIKDFKLILKNNNIECIS